MSRPKPKKWKPKNPQKYIGDVNNIIVRSSWETRLLNFLDETSSVLLYNSEELKIPYFSPIDMKMHTYYPDVLARMRLKDGSEKTYLIEVKPNHECLPPLPSKNKKKLLEQIQTWKVNTAKWDAAKAFCVQKGIYFLILDEYSLGLKKKSNKEANNGNS
jgi:hypothetical protein